MKIIFFGSSYFAVPLLSALLSSGYKPSCVVTQPDKHKGRGFKLSGTEVKETALKHKLAVYQPQNVNSADAIDFLKAKKPDLFIVVAYGQILSDSILSIPKIFSLNIHASLLPQYRGAAPVKWAIINGEAVTGVTAIKMIKKMDAGPIIFQEKVDVDPRDTGITLEGKLIKTGTNVLLAALRLIEDNRYCLSFQDETKATYAPSLQKESGKIDWDKPAEEIYNLIRGCLKRPGAFTYLDKKRIKIYTSEMASFPGAQKYAPGEIIAVSKNGIGIASGKGTLLIKELQPEGRRIMSAAEFIAGHKIKVGDILNV